jgi:AcrR family transcriptional regulator
MADTTEQLILNTARKHFVNNGFAATRMQEIADEAGINKAMVHYYFRSKEKLYSEIIGHTLDAILPKLSKAMSTPGTFWEKLDAIVSIYVKTLTDQPEIPFFVMSEISQKRERFVSELKKRSSFFPAVQSFLAQMHEEMEAGRMRIIPPFHLFLNIMGMTIFPYMSKPIFITVLDVGEAQFEELMKERKEVIINFIKHALIVEK